tara:strand:- start:506 stop:727 length:222 start_codon:yes stop_codon:yes gene_type:complete
MMQHYSEYIPGKTVTFKGCIDEQVKWGNCDAPHNLILARTYVLEEVKVHSQHTKLKLQNVVGWFNSVHFEVSN